MLFFAPFAFGRLKKLAPCVRISLNTPLFVFSSKIVRAEDNRVCAQKWIDKMTWIYKNPFFCGFFVDFFLKKKLRSVAFRFASSAIEIGSHSRTIDEDRRRWNACQPSARLASEYSNEQRLALDWASNRRQNESERCGDAERAHK